jgi:uncharacterized membrane protein
MGSGNLENQEQPSADEILQKAQQLIEERRQQSITPRKRQFVLDANHAVFWLSKHWLGMFNTLIALFVGGTLLAPLLLKIRADKLANFLYAFYDPFCHQYPFRSWFLFGESYAYPLHEPISIFKMSELTHFTGNPQVGYKLALCQRDMAIYTVMLLAGVLFGLLRRKLKIPPLPLWMYFIFGIMPMLLDGGVQWLSYFVWVIFPAFLSQPFETIPLMRTLTGGLFGLGVIAVTYPYIDEYFQEIYESLKVKYGW